MDFNAYSSEVLEWLEGVRKNRGTDAEKTLMLCKNIRDYAREQDDEKLLGYAYYYSGETYYLMWINCFAIFPVPCHTWSIPDSMVYWQEPIIFLPLRP